MTDLVCLVVASWGLIAAEVLGSADLWAAFRTGAAASKDCKVEIVGGELAAGLTVAAVAS